MNDRIAHLYEPTHPALVRLIKQIVDSAHKAKIKVSVCGEMAGDPLYTPYLKQPALSPLDLPDALRSLAETPATRPADLTTRP